MNRLASLCIVLFAGFILSAAAWAQEGVINLGPEEIVQAQGKDIVVPGYSVPSFDDWDGDGLNDLIVGEGGGGAPGKVRVYLNVGTASDPCFADYFYVQSFGGDLTFPASGCLGCFPRLVDWDGRDFKDLLVGLSDGTVKLVTNVTREGPPFGSPVDVKVGSGDAYTLNVGSRATPSLVHWNDDGMLDIVCGAFDGAIHVYYNCGCGGSVPPHFNFSPIDGAFVPENKHDLLVPSGRSSPAVFDADGDGRKDLLVGCTDGTILFYKNVGTASLPAFVGYTLVQSDGVPIDLPGGLRSRPATCYWNGPNDSYWDLLVGYGDGKVRLYRGLPKQGDFNDDGTLDADDFTFLVRALDLPVPPEGTPADLNGDGVVDDLDLRLFADLWLVEHPVEKK